MFLKRSKTLCTYWIKHGYIVSIQQSSKTFLVQMIAHRDHWKFSSPSVLTQTLINLADAKESVDDALTANTACLLRYFKESVPRQICSFWRAIALSSEFEIYSANSPSTESVHNLFCSLLVSINLLLTISDWFTCITFVWNMYNSERTVVWFDIFCTNIYIWRCIELLLPFKFLNLSFLVIFTDSSLRETLSGKYESFSRNNELYFSCR